jgi:predicted HicB family RNase H-like nuclease
MKEESDFSKGERGKYSRGGASLSRPVHLDEDVMRYISALAAAREESLNTLVNRLLKKDIELIEAVK